jgi:hypothetical protein
MVKWLNGLKVIRLLAFGLWLLAVAPILTYFKYSSHFSHSTPYSFNNAREITIFWISDVPS